MFCGEKVFCRFWPQSQVSFSMLTFCVYFHKKYHDIKLFERVLVNKRTKKPKLNVKIVLKTEILAVSLIIQRSKKEKRLFLAKYPIILKFEKLVREKEAKKWMSLVPCAHSKALFHTFHFYLQNLQKLQGLSSSERSTLLVCSLSSTTIGSLVDWLWTHKWGKSHCLRAEVNKGISQRREKWSYKSEQVNEQDGDKHTSATG